MRRPHAAAMGKLLLQVSAPSVEPAGLHRKLWVVACALGALIASGPAGAQEVFAGVYAHEVDTPFTLSVHESGADVAAGFRFGRIEALRIIGRPAPYVIASVNTAVSAAVMPRRRIAMRSAATW